MPTPTPPAGTPPRCWAVRRLGGQPVHHPADGGTITNRSTASRRYRQIRWYHRISSLVVRNLGTAVPVAETTVE